jgi:asparagine synthase (glutamine-hydrolysing)
VTVRELDRPKEQITDETEALRAYEKAIKSAVEKRITGHEKVGVIFSGGVDSTLIAKLARDLGADVTCYTAGLPDSDDVIAARDAASSMGLKLRINELNEDKILEYLPEIIEAIEDWNQLQVEVSLPVFSSVKEAKKDGQRVLLTGQGADELFAGYDWYPRVLEEEGEEGLEASLWNDIKNLYKETLEREDKITMHNSIELRVPFLDTEVIHASMSIPIKFKTQTRDEMRKHIHRRLAEKVGVPYKLAWRKKDAAQHGSNVHETLENLALELGFSSLEVEYRPENEELGSVYRYRDSYGSPNTRLFLDTIAYHKGLMDTKTRKNFEVAMGDGLVRVKELIKSQRGD